MSQDSPTIASSKAPPPVVWRSWPLRDEPTPTRLLALALGMLAMAVIAVTSSGWLALMAIGVLLAAMWRHFVPVEYRVGARGFRQTFFGRGSTIRWSQIRVVELRARGVLLYPDTYFGPLRAMRGLYVPWRSHRKEVLRLVDFYASTVVVRSPYTKKSADQNVKAIIKPADVPAVTPTKTPARSTRSDTSFTVSQGPK